MAVDTLDVLAKTRLGLSPAEIAKLHDVTENYIAKIIDEAKEKGALGRSVGGRPAPLKKNEDRKKAREQIAGYVASGKTTTQAARKFNVSEQTVRNSCKEFGVKIPAPRAVPGGKANTFDVIVARLNHPEFNDSQIAEQMGVTRQYVYSILKRANEAGLFLAIEKAKKTAVDEAAAKRKK